MKKAMQVICGSILFILGIAGFVLPVVPTLPFLLIGTLLLMKGSQRFANWFKKTKIYQKQVKNFVEKRAVTLKQKLLIIGACLVMMIGGFIFEKHIVARIFTITIFTGFISYFLIKVKTLPKNNSN